MEMYSLNPNSKWQIQQPLGITLTIEVNSETYLHQMEVTSKIHSHWLRGTSKIHPLAEEVIL